MSKLKQIAFLAMVLTISVGCSKKDITITGTTQDFVAKELGQAVENAHSELATLSALRGQGVQVLIPPPDPKLSKKIDVHWTGSAREILENICLSVGYKFQIIGYSTQELPVVVYGKNTEAYELLEDIALQIEPMAVLKVDTISEIITLAYPSKAK